MSELTEIDQLLIERYLDKTLTDSALTQFKQRLTDAAFAAEVHCYEKAVIAIKAFGDTQLKALLQEEEIKLQGNNDELIEINDKIIELNTPQYKTQKIRSTRQNWAIAASLLVLISAGIYYFINKNKDVEPIKTESIFAANFKPYRNYNKPTVRDNTTKNIEEKAFSLYDNGEYDAALTYFEKIIPPVQTGQAPEYNSLFFQANAYLATHQTEKAIPILTQLSQLNNSEWQQKAEWYLALALLEKDVEKAKVLLEKIKNTANHPFQKQAAGIFF